MAKKFEPKNLKEAWRQLKALLKALNQSLETPYRIQGFAPGRCPLTGIEGPGFIVQMIDQAGYSDPVSLIEVQESAAGYTYLFLACIDPANRDARWVRQETDNPTEAAACGLSGILHVRFLQVAQDAADRMGRPPEPGTEALVERETSGAVVH